MASQQTHMGGKSIDMLSNQDLLDDYKDMETVMKDVLRTFKYEDSQFEQEFMPAVDSDVIKTIRVRQTTPELVSAEYWVDRKIETMWAYIDEIIQNQKGQARRKPKRLGKFASKLAIPGKRASPEYEAHIREELEEIARQQKQGEQKQQQQRPHAAAGSPLPAATGQAWQQVPRRPRAQDGGRGCGRGGTTSQPVGRLHQDESVRIAQSRSVATVADEDDQYYRRARENVAAVDHDARNLTDNGPAFNKWSKKVIHESRQQTQRDDCLPTYLNERDERVRRSKNTYAISFDEDQVDDEPVATLPASQVDLPKTASLRTPHAKQDAVRQDQIKEASIQAPKNVVLANEKISYPKRNEYQTPADVMTESQMRTLQSIWTDVVMKHVKVKEGCKPFEVRIPVEKDRCLFGGGQDWKRAQYECFSLLPVPVRLYIYYTEDSLHVGIQAHIDKQPCRSDMAMLQMYIVLRNWSVGVETGSEKTLPECLRDWRTAQIYQSAGGDADREHQVIIKTNESTEKESRDKATREQRLRYATNWNTAELPTAKEAIQTKSAIGWGEADVDDEECRDTNPVEDLDLDMAAVEETLRRARISGKSAGVEQGTDDPTKIQPAGYSGIRDGEGVSRGGGTHHHEGHSRETACRGSQAKRWRTDDKESDREYVEIKKPRKRL